MSAIVLILFVTFSLDYYLLFGHPALIFVIGGPILFFLFVTQIERTAIPVMNELRLWEGFAAKGAKAEEQIGDILDGLPGEWEWLHDVNKEYGNIDHLGFRKDGAVFLIETKSHDGKITQQEEQLRRNGQLFEKNFITQTHRNVLWVKKIIKARLGFEPQWVCAVIVFSNAYVERHLKIKGVAIVNVSFLPEWIRRQPGNPKVAAVLWPKIEILKNELSSFVPNHLAPQQALR